MIHVHLYRRLQKEDRDSQDDTIPIFGSGLVEAMDSFEHVVLFAPPLTYFAAFASDREDNVCIHETGRLLSSPPLFSLIFFIEVFSILSDRRNRSAYSGGT